MDLTYLWSAVAVMGVVTFASRIFPFVAFNRFADHSLVQDFSRKLPPMILCILVVYCLKDLKTTVELRSAAVALGFLLFLHWKFKRSIFSIFSGTAFYLILLKFWK